MIEELRAALLEFDGQAISYLSETSVKYCQHPGYLSSLVGLAKEREASMASGATWLLKNHLESGGALTPDLVEPLLRALAAASSWSADLHILQSVQYLDLSEVTDPAVFDLTLQHVEHDRPFVRAWAVDATCRLADRFRDRRALAKHALDTAMNDNAASVRARARRISKELSV